MFEEPAGGNGESVMSGCENMMSVCVSVPAVETPYGETTTLRCKKFVCVCWEMRDVDAVREMNSSKP